MSLKRCAFWLNISQTILQSNPTVLSKTGLANQIETQQWEGTQMPMGRSGEHQLPETRTDREELHNNILQMKALLHSVLLYCLLNRD